VIALAERTGLRTPFMMVPAGELRAIAGRAGIRLPDGVPDPFQTVLPVVSLTVRERVVLAELGTGAAIASIAERLHVSTSTVKSQAASIYRKLGVATRADATARARQRGLLDG
jgi:LuxR family maltose regulon positive regulatory protein